MDSMCESIILNQKEVLEDYSYNSLDIIGRSDNRTIYKASKDSIDLEKPKLYAIKKISFSKKTDFSYTKFLLEKTILEKISHSNIIKYVETLNKGSNTSYLITKLCNHGNMLEFIRFNKLFRTIKEIFSYFLQIMNAIAYLHLKNIIFLDLCPENILFHNKTIKLSNIYSSQLSLDDFMRIVDDRPNFFAPEIILEKKYDSQSDIWSAGLILYYMIYDRLPWGREKSLKELTIYFRNIKSEEEILDFPEEWRFNVSNNVKNIIKSMLKINPIDRIKLKDIISDPLMMIFGTQKTKKEISFESIPENHNTNDRLFKNKTMNEIPNKNSYEKNMFLSVWQEENEKIVVNPVKTMSFRLKESEK